ncbi:MAG: hypothetical protein ACXVCY_19390 [Pseudobdellovibrionaceae bacterium]
MKKIVFVSLLLSSSAFAMPNPQYVPFDNIAQFGKYIENNMSNIIDSSVALAQEAYPGKDQDYFLVTKSVSLETFDSAVDSGKAPFAVLEMSSSSLTCTRAIYSKVKANKWGEGRVLTFVPAPTINCQ